MTAIMAAEAKSLPRVPTLVSFYGGSRYYYEAAERLMQACERLGVPHDIQEVTKREDESWSHICRRKIPFYRDMLAKHPDGIFWADVDTVLVQRPALFDNASYDIAAFLRGFRNLRDYDPVQLARTFHPGFIHFNGTGKTRRFVEHMAALERDSTSTGTDDFFLEEAWQSFPEALAVMLLPGDMIAKTEARIGAGTCFVFGESGNVAAFKGQVEQHAARVFELRRQTRLLINYAAQCIRNGKREQARTFLQKAHGIDRTDHHAALSLARLSLKMDDPEGAARVVKATFGGAPEAAEPRKILVEAALATGNWRRAHTNLQKLEAMEEPEVQAFAQSRRFLVGLEKRAEALQLRREERPAVYWMDTPFPGNFGDVLNPFLVESLSGLPPRHAREGDGILAIGSVIKFARPGTVVWGTGTPRMTDVLSPEADYRAVRGPMSRQLVENSGGKPPDVFGDPAMLLPLIHTPRSPKRHKLGFIRHYTHQHEPIRCDGVKEISILCVGEEGIRTFIDEVNECEHIASTSLHGLIVAHAYGIPTRWCDFLEADWTLPGDGTKFEDHYAAFGIRFRPPTNLSGVPVMTPAFAAECDEVVTRPFDAAALLRVAPFPLLPRFRSIAGLDGGAGHRHLSTLGFKTPGRALETAEA
ncbi:polysaccharide pyruvyl transferase family protein [Muricoccus vinaceus]|uniref:Polysaccharide pyruvyl transferase family protein n=1 Tax=Muricoccus vinaceus TaxID=424704 RepID=A0ABV6ILT4_9PROT